MKRLISLAVAGCFLSLSAFADNIVFVDSVAGDATAAIREAISKAASFNDSPVTVRLAPAVYNISREQSTRRLYHISNTASAEENPDQIKHIGILFENLSNITFDGGGARIVTHGEMTPLLLDNCSNIRLCSFSLDAADPSVPEFTVRSVDGCKMVAEVTPPSRFMIEDGVFTWIGEGWRFPGNFGGVDYPLYAQVFYPERNVTLRTDSPLSGYTSARRIGENLLEFTFPQAPRPEPGEVYQMRHGVRNEACALINRCSDVTLENLNLHFMGNFGLVGQYSRNITYNNIRCAPAPGSGRTDAGFADFVQMSGCAGLVRILNSHFEGAHDDPINIHGTHLQLVECPAPDSLLVRFMHGQTYGFPAFYSGDEVEIVNRHTLLPLCATVVRSAEMLDDYTMAITLADSLPPFPDGAGMNDFAVENVTWTPEVEIRNNFFARIPTRGILITTRRRALIEDNVFYRIPMPSILLSDDARGWYESGPVKNLTIRGNQFIECASPVISINPEIDTFAGPVHENITVDSNRFIFPAVAIEFSPYSASSPVAVKANAAANLRIVDNVFVVPASTSNDESTLIETTDTSSLQIDSNRIVSE